VTRAPAIEQGRREATKAANRAAILAAARSVFAEIGFGAASVRDVIRRTDLATGTFYNYFPDKESVLREILDENTEQIRVRVRAARREAGSVDAFVGDGFRAYLEHLAGDREMLELMSRNAGTIRAMFDGPALGAGVDELREDLEAGVASGLLASHDCELMAAAMVGAGVEIGMRLAGRDQIDVEGPVELLTSVFAPVLRAR
jgi:AcrR family transcriptional regulator